MKLKPPDWLSQDALARWNQVKGTVQPTTSAEALAEYCTVWARWRSAEDKIAQYGSVVARKRTDAKGSVVSSSLTPSPYVAIANQTLAQLRVLEQRAGLSSSDTSAGDDDRGEQITRRALAAALNVHMMTVTKWERDGMPIAHRGRKGKPSTYREADVRRWLEAREHAAQTGGIVDLARDRARKERAQAELAEQTIKTRSRELLPRHEVERLWSAHVTAVRAKLLALPSTLADQLCTVAATAGPDGVEAALSSAVVDVLRELAQPSTAETRIEESA